MITKILLTSILVAVPFISKDELEPNFCDQTAASFPMPEVDCINSDNLLVSLCINYCYNNYVETSIWAYSEACDEAAKVNQNYQACKQAALIDYNNCMRSACTPAAKAQCQSYYQSVLQDCLQTKLVECGKIVANLYVNLNKAYEDFYVCTDWCCNEK